MGILKEVLGDDELKVIAHELTKTIKENMSVDWNVKDSTREKMRVAVRRLLKNMAIHPIYKKWLLNELLNKQN